MKAQTLSILALLLLVTALAALAGQAAFASTLAPASPTAPVGMPTAAPSAAPQASLTPQPSVTPVPTPTAEPLPTRVSERQPRSDSPRPTQPSLLDQYLPERVVVAQTEHFVFYAQDGYFPVDLDWFTQEAEVVYDYVSRRLDGRQVQNKVALGFMPPDERTCPVRGLASHSRTPMVLIYADADSSREFILGVLAHELGHAIPSEGFPGGLPDYQPLTEGLATWASGRYWDEYKQVGSIHDLVRAAIADGRYQPLRDVLEFTAIYPWHDDAGPNCLDERDRVYAQWGSFLGYLVETYGWDKAYDLFRAPEPLEQGGQVIEFPPDFEGVYGKSLNQLEHDWLLATQK